MRMVIQKIAFLVLPLALLLVSACGSHHHRSHHDRDGWHDGAYDRGDSRDRYDGRDRHKNGDQYHRGDRYGGNDWSPWLRW